jgi:hypothetical protein
MKLSHKPYGDEDYNPDDIFREQGSIDLSLSDEDDDVDDDKGDILKEMLGEDV